MWFVQQVYKVYMPLVNKQVDTAANTELLSTLILYTEKQTDEAKHLVFFPAPSHSWEMGFPKTYLTMHM